MVSKEEAKVNKEMLMLSKHNKAPRIGASSSQYEPEELMVVGIKPNMLGLNAEPCPGSEETSQNPKDDQEVGNVVPKLSYELEVVILARLPCFEHWKLLFLNKRFSQLLKTNEIYGVRRKLGFAKPYVFMRPGGDSHWTMFDNEFDSFRRLPSVPSDYCFLMSDKETICAGTQLIVVGREVESDVVWRYELATNKWFKGPRMIVQRAMFGSASRGNDAFFAGGIMVNEKGCPEVVNTVEKYNADTKTWTMIQGMHKKRKCSSGCFLRGKFLVIGGLDENSKNLTCGESYNEAIDSWELIVDMFKDMTFLSPQSPPLIAVVEDNLYMLETSLNELRVYDAKSNAWKKLGLAPVRANAALGWGVAFKSLGDRLMVIGASVLQSWPRTMSVYTCRPCPDAAENQIWEALRHCCDRVELDHFIHNCCVMFA